LYLDHFGLAEEPFSVTSDPRFLFLSESHEEALAHLVYCVEYHKGFAAITGEVGTGKTTLLNTLISRLDHRHSIAFVYQSADSTTELMRYIFKDLSIQCDCRDRTELLGSFNDYLLQEKDAGREVVLVVDEAQNLSIEVLEDLRLISNFESSNKKLVQIILAGQSELGLKLRLPELRQLNQRIAIQYVLQPLCLAETGSYIQHRLKTAGTARVDIFHPKAIRAVFQASGGIPRLINQICDTSLLRAANSNKQLISTDCVRKVIGEEFQFRSDLSKIMDVPRLIHYDKRKQFKLLGLAVVVTVLSMLTLAWLGGYPGPLASHEKAGERNSENGSDSLTESQILRNRLESTEADLLALKQQYEQVRGTTNTSRQDQAELGQEAIQRVVRNSKAAGGNSALEGALPVDRLQSNSKTDELIQDHENPGMVLVRIRKGDTMVRMIRRIHGAVSWDLVQEVWKLNPGMKNPNMIRFGDYLRMPANKQ
jgi:general secretion pathway protein A